MEQGTKYSAVCWHILGAPQPGGRRKALPLGSRPLPLHPSAEKPQSLRGFPKQPSVCWKSKGQNSFLFLIETDLIDNTVLFSVFHFLLSPSAEVLASAHSAGSCLAARSQSRTPFPSDHSEMQLSAISPSLAPATASRNPEWWLPALHQSSGDCSFYKASPRDPSPMVAYRFFQARN